MVREIVERETEKYASTLERGTRIVQKVAKTYKAKSQRVPLAEVMVLYDSHGIQPEMIKEIAAKEGAVVDLPDNFYSMVADMHSESKKEAEVDKTAKYAERLQALPPTKKLYYDQPSDIEFEAVVLDFFDGYAVLDQTLFYPEGGGQPADTGTLIGSESMAQVDGVVKVGEVILHHIAGGILRRGERIKGMVDEERRWSLMRHHTATHVLLHATKEVLGAHIHQAGAQKGSESSRVDIRHFKHITPDELRRIEVAANRMIMASQPVEIEIEDRTKAEQKYGFSLYQGGVPPGRDIRIVKVAGDIEACAGTHCQSTGEVGMIKIIRVEHIQDGIERIEFAAGIAAIYYMQHLEGIVTSSAAVLSVQDDNLPATVTRFFNEWKEQRKDLERMTAKLVELEMRTLVAETIGGISVVVKRIDLPQKELALLATSVSEKGGVALLAGAGEIGPGGARIRGQPGECRGYHRAGLRHAGRQGRRQTLHGTGWRAGCSAAGPCPESRARADHRSTEGIIMADNVVFLEPGDERAQKIAKAMGSQTASDILQILGEGPRSLTDITERLNIPMNTAKYHIENLLDAGLIAVEKTKYSIKGREVKIYMLTNQLLVVAPRQSNVRSLLLKYASLFGIVAVWFGDDLGHPSPLFGPGSMIRGSANTVNMCTGICDAGVWTGMTAWVLQRQSARAWPRMLRRLPMWWWQGQKVWQIPGPQMSHRQCSPPMHQPSPWPAHSGTDSNHAARTRLRGQYPAERCRGSVPGLDPALAFFLGGVLVIFVLLCYEAWLWKKHSR